MPTNKTPIYNLPYLVKGSDYSARSDFRRFVTLDYNMESYVGIVGIGVLDGWTVEHVSGLTIQILPGSGLIQGYASESPYTFKQRSEIVSGEREYDVVSLSSVPQANMSIAEKNNYVSVRQEYEPDYVPTDLIENAYIKAVTPYQITLQNNWDTYIIAERKFSNPYPSLSDYPLQTIAEPVRNDYASYQEYFDAVNAYESELGIIWQYQWRDNPDNHFTVVDFLTRNSFVKNSSQVLLAKVVTRNGTVTEIDMSGVDSIANFRSKIEEFAGEVINNHKHGGNGSFDPSAIQLATDVRSTALKAFDIQTGKATYAILSGQFTTIVDGHKHTFYTDLNGDGFTIDHVGSGVKHWHKIDGFQVQNQETSSETINNHIHVLPSIENEKWEDGVQFVVYTNGEVYGNHTSTNIVANYENGTIELLGFGSGVVNATYSTTFTHEASTEPYVFSYKTYSLLSFMLKMQIDFNARYGNALISEVDGCLDASKHPFLFVTDGCTSLDGLEPLTSQCTIGQQLLKNEGDVFVFTPNAAKNIAVTLVKKHTESNDIGDTVRVEILGNSEVTGKLKIDNIAYISANKFTSGIFDIERIPFISHVGRMEEKFLPFSYPLVSNDGIKFSVVPYLTEASEGHYHNLFLDNTSSGISKQTFIDEDPVWYAYEGENSYLIQHAHSVQNGVVRSEDSSELTSWRNAVNNSNAASSSHTHEIVRPIQGDSRIIYSIVEDSESNLFIGTSSGAMCIPNARAFLFVINEIQVYIIENDLWTAFNLAKAQYEKRTKLPFAITEDIYLDQITIADTKLVNSGDSEMIYGELHPTLGRDAIMIKCVAAFDLPSFKYVTEKRMEDIQDDETIISARLVDGNNSEEISESDLEYSVSTNAELVANGDEPVQHNYVELYTVERNLQDVPSWDFDIRKEQNGERLIATTPNVSSNVMNPTSDFYLSWNHSNMPFYAGALKKTFVDSIGNLWSPTENGLLISRYYQNGSEFALTNNPSIRPETHDVIEGEPNSIFCATYEGVSKTIDGGKTWSLVLSVNGGVSQLLRDYKLDRTSSTDHYHTLIIDQYGNGVTSQKIGASSNHTHVVSAWGIQSENGHTHTIVTKLYVIGFNNQIYQSTNNGQTWALVSSLPEMTDGNAFAFNGKLFVSKGNEVLQNQDDEWVMVIDTRGYSFAWSNDFSKMYVGAYNTIYETLDGETFSIRYQFENSGPLTILINNGETFYGNYAYNSIANAFFFKSRVYTNTNLNALVDFGKWRADNGSWGENAKYDIYIGKRLTLSTKRDIDDREELGYSFSIDNSFGMLDFSANTALSVVTKVNDSYIKVISSEGFSIGDRVAIISMVNYGNSPSKPQDESSLFEYFGKLESYNNRKSAIYNMRFWANVTSVSDTTIFIDEKIDRVIETPAMVYRIPNVDGQTEIMANIYDSYLSDIGVNIHEDVEDALSRKSDFKPYQLNNAFISNLLHITQAVRFVYPDINEKFVNSNFFDFKYSSDSSDPNYIGNYIDLLQSDIYNDTKYQSPFSKEGATTIYSIMIGTGDFTGKLFATTDIGMFWTDITSSFNEDWTYVSTLKMAIFDAKVFGQESLYVATSNGIYSTTDLNEWYQFSDPSITFRAKKLAYRWGKGETITIASHAGRTYNNTDNPDSPYGIIKADTNQYYNLSDNRKILLSGADSHIGTYTIRLVKNAKEIELYEAFPNGNVNVNSSMGIEMSSWWEKFDGEDNTGNSNLKNVFLVGGDGNIAYSSDGNIWAQSSIPDVSEFSITDFEPLSSGIMLASAKGTNLDNRSSYVLRSDDLGSSWEIYFSNAEVRGTINSYRRSEFGHSIINVNYTYPADLQYVDGQYDKLDFVVFDGENRTVFQGKCIWNDSIDGQNYIYVFGTDLLNIMDGETLSAFRFEIWPTSIKSIAEGHNHEVFFGTESGIYSDQKNTLTSNLPGAEIVSINFNGTVNRIDLPGRITSVSKNAATNNIVVQATFDDQISSNSIVGRLLYVVDLAPVKSAKILSNKGQNVGGEVSVELELTWDDTWNNYSGKSIVVVDSQTRIYASFSNNIDIDQFAGGTLKVTSNENLNVDKEYTIKSNTKEYVVLTEPLVPVSSFGSSFDSNDNVIVGQSFSMSDGSKKTILFVSFDKNVARNEYVGFYLRWESIENANQTSITPLIITNDTNSITVAPVNGMSLSSVFNVGDRITPVGIAFKPLVGFNNQKTSKESDHYHDLELIGAILNGSIESFISQGSSMATILINSVNGFENELVQRSGELLKGAKILLSNSNEFGIKNVFGTIVSHTAETITLTMDNPSEWDFEGYNIAKASVGWKWAIDASTYGYTKNTIYEDFVEFSSLVNANILVGSTSISVKDSSGFLIGQKIVIEDVMGAKEYNSIESVDGPTAITISSPVDKSYFAYNSPQVKVLVDDFTNEHVHMVRKNQVESLKVNEYLDRGYSSIHSHTVQAFLPAVNGIFVKDEEIISIGDDKIIYKSYNDGATWLRKVNLNFFLEGAVPVSAVVCGDISSNGKLIVGTQNGSVFVEGG